MYDLGIVEQKGQIVVSSRDVARIFEKEHARVMRDIRELSEIEDDFRLGNFAESEYVDKQGRKQPEFLLTKNGVTILVMGYTGDKAMKFKVAYIKEFDRMEAALNEKTFKSEEVKRIVALFVADIPEKWHKVFKDELFIQICRLWNLSEKYLKTHRFPQCVGNIIKKYIYLQLPHGKEIFRELKGKCNNERFHQWLTEDVGYKTLEKQIENVILLMQVSSSKQEFEGKFQSYLNRHTLIPHDFSSLGIEGVKRETPRL